jgi:hypothetical protein
MLTHRLPQRLLQILGKTGRNCLVHCDYNFYTEITHDTVRDQTRSRAESNMHMLFQMGAYTGGPTCDRSGSSLLKFSLFYT